MQAFFESTGFEDAIRNAISIGGDSDTIAAICGGVAEAYYGIPTDIRKHALTFLDQNLMQLLVLFENKYPPIMEKKREDMSLSIKRLENINQLTCTDIIVIEFFSIPLIINPAKSYEYISPITFILLFFI